MEKKNLEEAIKKINKAFGANTIQKLSDKQEAAKNVISTGSLLIDKILNGGIAQGRIIELFGIESSGKSTLCLQVARECQKKGSLVAYIDVEQALDVDYARALGVNTEELIFTQPTSGEQALEIVDTLAKTGEVSLIIVDSVAALTPQAELDGEMSDVTIGLRARLMTKALGKITATLNEKNCAVIFINQLREKISTGFSMGPSETTPGGRALKFYASQRIELRKTTAIKEGGEVIGTNVKVKCVKNKIGVPMKVVELPMIFGKGFDSQNEALDLALEYEICKQSGAFYTSHDGQRFQGKAKLRAYYDENKDKADELLTLVKNHLNGVTLEPEYEIDPKTGEIIDE